MLPASGKLSIGELKVYNNVHWGICSLLLLALPPPHTLLIHPRLPLPSSLFPTSSRTYPPLRYPLLSFVSTFTTLASPLTSPLPSSNLASPLLSSPLTSPPPPSPPPPLSSTLLPPLTSHLSFTLSSTLLSPLSPLPFLPGSMQSAHQFLSVLLRKATAQVHSASVVVVESTAKAVTTAILESAIEGRVSFSPHLSPMHPNMRSIITC